MIVCGITRPLGRLFPTLRQVAHVLRTRSPVTLAGPRDLHVLSTPPAFVLSQDQTLQECLIKLSRTTLSTLSLVLSVDSVVRITEMFGLNSPPCPERTQDQRVRLAHPDSQIRLSISIQTSASHSATAFNHT